MPSFPASVPHRTRKKPPPLRPPSARNGGDERLAHAREPLVITCIVGAGDVDIRLICHLLNIGAGRKRFVGTGEKDAADIGIGVERLDRAEKLVLQRSIKRIQRLWSVKTNDADTAASFDNYGFGAHDYPWLSWRSRAESAGCLARLPLAIVDRQDKKMSTCRLAPRA